MAYLIANVILLVPFQYELIKELNISVSAMLAAVRAQFLSSLAMAAAVLVVKGMFPGIESLNSTLQLLILVPVGVMAYGGAMVVFFKSFIRSTFEDYKMLRRSGDSSAPAVA